MQMTRRSSEKRKDKVQSCLLKILGVENTNCLIDFTARLAIYQEYYKNRMMYCGRIVIVTSVITRSSRLSPIVKYNHSSTEKEELQRCYKVLNVAPDCDQEQVRSAFLALVKKYHPDSGSPEANSIKFQEVEAAYRTVQDNFSKKRWGSLEVGGEYGLYYQENQIEKDKVQEFDIKHTAPQHRQYLSYNGIGTGSPLQRQKQFEKYRAAVAIENVYVHRVSKLSGPTEDALVVKDKKASKKIKTSYGMDRLVEDLIQESMARGEFDNLSGKGKPLPKTAENPYVDFVTHKLNQVLIDNGFVPEWISLQKEIHEEANHIRKLLSQERNAFECQTLSSIQQQQWNDVLMKMRPLVTALNTKINKYNLVVPLLRKQMLQFKLDREAEHILQQRPNPIYGKPSNKANTKPASDTQYSSLISFITSFFH